MVKTHFGVFDLDMIGVLAVTRSLGDVNMKHYIIGSPYTTETVLGDDDSLLILACDGVSIRGWIDRGSFYLFFVFVFGFCFLELSLNMI